MEAGSGLTTKGGGLSPPKKLQARALTDHLCDNSYRRNMQLKQTPFRHTQRLR